MLRRRALGALDLGLQLGLGRAQPLGGALHRGLRRAQRIRTLAHGRARVGAVGALVEAAHAFAHVAQPREPALERLELLEAAREATHQILVDRRQADGELFGDAGWVERLRQVRPAQVAHQAQHRLVLLLSGEAEQQVVEARAIVALVVEHLAVVAERRREL